MGRNSGALIFLSEELWWTWRSCSMYVCVCTCTKICTGLFKMQLCTRKSVTKGIYIPWIAVQVHWVIKGFFSLKTFVCLFFYISIKVDYPWVNNEYTFLFFSACFSQVYATLWHVRWLKIHTELFKRFVINFF